MSYSLTLSEIKQILKKYKLLITTNIKDDDNTVIEKLTYDSRNVDDKTFFICKGVAFKDDYLKMAVESKAIGFVSEKYYDEYVDTVPFGAFRREVFEKWGGYDERLTRNQDNEMNYRIRKNGGKIYLSSDIKLSYYCRDSIKGISDMAVKNGMWNVITIKLCPGSMGVRHFIPLLFLLSLIILPIAGIIYHPIWWLFALEMALYFALDCLFSAKQASGIKEFLLLVLLFPIFHITYGAGSLKGILKLFSKEYR